MFNTQLRDALLSVGCRQTPQSVLSMRRWCGSPNSLYGYVRAQALGVQVLDDSIEGRLKQYVAAYPQYYGFDEDAEVFANVILSADREAGRSAEKVGFCDLVVLDKGRSSLWRMYDEQQLQKAGEFFLYNFGVSPELKLVDIGPSGIRFEAIKQRAYSDYAGIFKDAPPILTDKRGILRLAELRPARTI